MTEERKAKTCSRIEGQLQLAQGASMEYLHGFRPVFPFPLAGPLLPLPADKAQACAQFQKARLAMALTTLELAEFLGLSSRTLEKWQQGRSRVDPSAWKLLQLTVRLQEVRKIL